MTCLSESLSMVLGQRASESMVLFAALLVLDLRHPSSFVPDPSESIGTEIRLPEISPRHLRCRQQQHLAPTLPTTNMPYTTRCSTCTHTAYTSLQCTKSENEGLTGFTLTLCFLCGPHLFFYCESFPGVYYIDYRTWSSGFEIFQERPGVTAVGVGGVYAFGGEIVQFLEVGVPVCGLLGIRIRGDWVNELTLRSPSRRCI